MIEIIKEDEGFIIRQNLKIVDRSNGYIAIGNKGAVAVGKVGEDTECFYIPPKRLKFAIWLLYNNLLEEYLNKIQLIKARNWIDTGWYLFI